MRMKKSSKGFTLVEILIVIGVIGIIAALSYRIVGGSGIPKDANIVSSDIRALHMAGINYKQGDGTYTGATISQAVSDGLLASDWTTRKNPSGGTYTMAASTSNGLTVTATALKKGICPIIQRQLNGSVRSVTCDATGALLTVVFD